MNTRRSQPSRNTRTIAVSTRARVSGVNALISPISNPTTALTLSTLVTLLAFAVALDTQAGRRTSPVRTHHALAAIRGGDEPSSVGARCSITRRIAEAARDFLRTNIQPVAILQSFAENQDPAGAGGGRVRLTDVPRHLQHAELVLRHLRNLPPPVRRAG